MTAQNNNISELITEKMLRVHTVIAVAVCVLFGVSDAASA